MNNQYSIKYVAHYLRKSRGDEDKDLENHRILLNDISLKNKWKYVEYHEIGTSDDIDLRPEFCKLLQDIREGLYDAVLVVDYDRLGRGSGTDQDTIQKAFKDSNTLIVTPTNAYDLNNEGDEQTIDFKAFMARHEYKTIIKRLIRGKKIGARRGFWTNGTPPFPYEYERWETKYNEKGIVVNDDKYLIYRKIIEMALDGYSTNEIAIKLNNDSIPSPRSSFWTNITIGRLLIDETHLGKIISNKTSGDGHKQKKANAKPVTKNNKDEWVVVENCHEAVKTQEEHDRITKLIESRRKISPRAKKRYYSLSGLIKCGKCGRGLTFTYSKKYDKTYMKPCWYKYPTGKKCGNKGFNYRVIEDAIIGKITTYSKEYKEYINSKDYTVNTEEIERQLTTNKKNIKKYKLALDRVNDTYEFGDYTREEWLSRKEKWNAKITETSEQIEILERELNNASKDTDKEKLKMIESKAELLRNPEIEVNDKNMIYHSLLNSVTWLNDGEKQKLIIDWKNPLP